MMVKKLEKVSYEDALDMTGFGKFNYLMLALVGSMIMGMASEIFSVSFLVTASACELGTVSSQQALIAGTPLVGIIASSHFWGYLADTQGRRKILCVSLMVGFCAGFVATFSPNWIVYMLLKFASSCGVAGTYALALTLLGECTPHTKRTTMIAYTTSIFLISTGSMAIITIPVLPLTFSYYIPYLNIHFNSWRLLNIIYCIPCALGALGVLKSYESPKYLLSVGEEEKALEILRGIHAINNGKDAVFKVTSVILDEERKKNVVGLWASLKSQTTPLLKPPLLKKTLLLSLLFIIVYFCLNPYMVWLPYIADGIMRAIERDDGNITFCQMLQTSLDVTKTQTSNCGLDQTAMIMVFCIDVFMAILNIILTTIMSCTGRKTLLISLQLLSGVAGLLVNLSSSWIVSNILFIIYVSGVLNFGFLATFVVDVFPTYVKAMAVCLCLMVGRGSSVLGINILKALLINHCQLSFYCFAGLAIVGGLLSFLLPSDLKKKKNVES
ncbi:putative transporter svop-1 isoform X1 [Papilio machaon]|uniref:putative transporter svop-1 isoform X1 n=1 Tax=Papilio machaon TaxID=76193 RepID=UPI001E663F1C|nr:putative transporter svop-1 isoform X1 [Papilio machaon]